MKKLSFLCLSLFVALAATADDWTLVTDAADLQAGDVIVLAHSNKNATAGLEVGKSGKGDLYLQAVESTFGNDIISSLGSGSAEFTLSGNASGWTLTNQKGEKLGVTKVKSIAWNNGTTTWTISIIGGDATIESTNDSYGTLLYNVGSPRFTTYSSTGNQMKLVQIYRKAVSTKYALTYKDYPYKKTVCDVPTYAAGHKVTLSTGKPKKEGNVFKGWKYNDQTYQPGAEFTMPETDAELVALWETGEETLSDDATIKELKIKGETVTAVNDVYSYEFAVEIPAVEVTYTLNHSGATGTPKTGFTITVPAAGEPAATQVISVVAENGVAKKEYTVSVAVTGGQQGIEDVQNNEVQCTKVLRNGQLLIIRGEAVYNAMGVRVK